MEALAPSPRVCTTAEIEGLQVSEELWWPRPAGLTSGQFPPVSDEDQRVGPDVDGVEDEGEKERGEEESRPDLASLSLEFPGGLGNALDGSGLLQNYRSLSRRLELSP